MNNFRQPPRRPRQTLDGFFAGPAQGTRRQTFGHRPTQMAGPLQPSQRRVDNFRRPDGLYNPAPTQVRPSPSVVRSRSLPPLSMNLPEAGTEVKKARKAKKPLTRMRKARKWTLRTAIAMFVLVLGIGGFLAAQGYLKIHKIFSGSSSAAALSSNVDPSLLKGEGDGRVNILILGVGGAGHDGPDLTDTMLLASIDPVNNQASLLSIPRDLWVKMPNNYIANYQKINAAYESGKYKYLGKDDASNANKQAITAGFSAVDSTVEQVLGVPIHYNALVDFQAFQQAVNTVGGVTVNVPTELYDPTMAWENHWNPVLAKAGVQTMNGTQALIYARSRETTSDFARAERQRQIMVALKDKIFTIGTLSNPLKISQLLSAFGDNVQTDISLSDMSRLITILKKINNAHIKSSALTDISSSSGGSGTSTATPTQLVTTDNLNGISVVRPVAGYNNYTDIQTYVRGLLKDGFIAKENANVMVLNGTTTPGLATAKSTELKSYGYNVGTVANAPTSGYTETQIIDLTHGADKYTLHYLQGRFGVQSISTQVPPGVTPGNANIIVILGSNETFTNQN